MSNISDFVQIAQQRAHVYKKCSPEQALVYVCEDLTDENIGSLSLNSLSASQWIEKVCEQEDIDTPEVHVLPGRTHIRGSSLLENNSICLYGNTAHASTLIHEIAHLMSDGHSHGILFRDEMVRLSRAHISIDYAAMLHALYMGCQLQVSPWEASAIRR